MICIDTREKGQLDRHLQRHGLPVSVTAMEFGDITWEGHGPSGPVMVSVERKRMDAWSQDLITSMTDRRLSGHQLRGMREAYDYLYLVVEGVWKEGPGGEIVIPVRSNGKTEWKPLFASGRSVSYRQVVGYLDSISLRVRATSTGEPLRVIQTGDEYQTASRLAALYRLWTEKRWDEHHSHDELYTGLPKKGHKGGWAVPHSHTATPGVRVGIGIPTVGTTAGNNSNGHGVTDHPTTLWRMAAQLPGVDRRALGLSKHFRTVDDMVLAGLPDELKREVKRWWVENPGARERSWMECDGVGPAIAGAAVRALSEEGA